MNAKCLTTLSNVDMIVKSQLLNDNLSFLLLDGRHFLEAVR